MTTSITFNGGTENSAVPNYSAGGTPDVEQTVGPDPAFAQLVQSLTAVCEISVELTPWLRAGEETLGEVDRLFG